jgi:hypothetical protein
MGKSIQKKLTKIKKKKTLKIPIKKKFGKLAANITKCL